MKRPLFDWKRGLFVACLVIAIFTYWAQYSLNWGILQFGHFFDWGMPINQTRANLPFVQAWIANFRFLAGIFIALTVISGVITTLDPPVERMKRVRHPFSSTWNRPRRIGQKEELVELADDPKKLDLMPSAVKESWVKVLFEELHIYRRIVIPEPEDEDEIKR